MPEKPLKWCICQKTQDSLIAAARKARQEIAEGKAEPLDYEQLWNLAISVKFCAAL
jgi:hypothetical protein